MALELWYDASGCLAGGLTMNKAGSSDLIASRVISAAHAEQFGTADEARAMLDRAISGPERQ